jgi:hypothetical protein
MADQNEKNTPQGAGGSIPQQVADELAQLDAEVHAAARKAARSWKTTAIFFVVLLAVIATYLAILVYRPVKAYLKEDAVVEMAFSRIDAILAAQGVPGLNDASLVTWAVKKLDDQAPELTEKVVKPFIQDKIKQLPEWRKQAVEQIKAKGPGYLDQAVARAKADLLPQARGMLVERTVQQANAYLDQVEPQLDQAVAAIIEQHKEDIKNLNPDDVDVMKQAISKSMEEQFAPILDPWFDKVGGGLDITQTGLQDLIAKMNSGTLSHEEDLEIGAVQLTYALFKLRAPSDQSDMGLYERFQDIIQRTTSETPGAVPAVNVTTGAAKTPTPQELQNQITALENALKAPDLSEQQRKAIQERLDAAKAQLTGAKATPAPASGAAPAAAAARAALSPDARLAAAKGKVEGLTKALSDPNISAQAKEGVKAQLEAAKKELEALQAKP